MTDMTTATRLYTYADYLALPDDGNRYEIIDGELYVTPGPFYDHQYSSSMIQGWMFIHVMQNDLGVVLTAPTELHLSESTRPIQPDLLFFRKGHIPSSPHPKYVEIAPDLVVEILSASTARTDQTVKFSTYEKAGVEEYWIVEPRVKNVAIWVLQEGKYVERGKYTVEDVVTSQVLTGFQIEGRKLFL